MKYPIINKDVIAFDKEGNMYYCFLSRCKEWRCQISGGMLLINVVEWKYDNEKL